MIEPLFQNDIFSSLLRNYSHYLTYKYWFLHFILIIGTLYLSYFYIKKTSLKTYPCLFPSQQYHFNLRNKYDWLSLGFFIFSLSLYVTVIYSLETTLFNNYDLMSSNTTKVFNSGVTPRYFINERLLTVAWFDINFLYAITHNFNIINIYTTLKVILICFLLYKLLDFLAPAKRLFLLGTIILLPSFFWLNSPIYPEYNAIIFMLLSFIFIKRFSNTNHYSNLWFFILFMNLALYTKESSILLYFGILLASFICNLYQEKITLKDFIHPLKTIQNFPLEFLIFLSLCLYSILYLCISSAILDNIYIIFRQADTLQLLSLYKLEIIFSFLAVGIFIKKFFQSSNRSSPLFNEGFLCGALVTVIFIIFFAQLAPILDSVKQKSYYLVSATIFLFLYILINLKNKTLSTIIIFLTIVYSLFTNYQIYHHEQGTYYRKAAEFIASKLSKNKTLNIYLAQNSEEIPWAFGAWASAYKYYFPNYSITFKSSKFKEQTFENAAFLHRFNSEKNIYFPFLPQSLPQKGDFYIVKKNKYLDHDLEILQSLKSQKIYDNQLFSIYEIQHD